LRPVLFFKNDQIRRKENVGESLRLRFWTAADNARTAGVVTNFETTPSPLADIGDLSGIAKSAIAVISEVAALA